MIGAATIPVLDMWQHQCFNESPRYGAHQSKTNR